MLKVGMGRVEITPPLGMELAGYPHYPRKNEGAHDPLYSTSMYISNGSVEVAIVSLDILYYSKKHVTEVRKRVEAACGIPAKNIMITCTHTHSGPWAAGRLGMETGEEKTEAYFEFIRVLNTQIVESIVASKTNAVEGSFAAEVELCGAESGVGGNRRMPGGPHDPLVSVLAIRDANNKVLGALVNYTLHPTFIHEWSNVCTADFCYYVRLEVEEKYENSIVGFTQGTSGNQSSRYYRQGESYDEAERVGRKLGAAAIKAIEKAKWKTDMPIVVASEEIVVEIRDLGNVEEIKAETQKSYDTYKDLYDKYGESTNREEYYLWQNANLTHLGWEDRLTYAIRMSEGEEILEYVDETPAEAQAIRLDDMCVVGIPGEMFVEYGLFVKGMSPFRMTVVNELANGILPGYAYTPEAASTGGYETGASLLDPAFGMKLTLKAIEMAKKVSE